jgi:hypothetical protein
LGRFGEQLHSAGTVSLAACLLVAQILTLWLLWWRFEALFQSINSFIVHSGSLAGLSAAYSEEHKWYMRVFSMVALVFGWSWYRLVKIKPHDRESSGRTIWTAGTLIMIITLCFMVAPYRLFFHSAGEKVSYDAASCYLVGRKGTEALLFCPLEEPPWSRLVDLNDPALKRSGITAAIFPPPAAE